MPTFNHPSYRAAQSDLAISVSPLGLIELSDEEFEVHGPRLNRYSNYWAYYLGHHWGYRREAGESLLTFNYVRAFSDYITNFTFGRGFKSKTPQATEAIVPALLDRVWTKDNDRRKVTWKMGQVGGVTGDCFVKVAYEDPFQDPVGRVIAGKVRVIPLNSAYAFPEWHPHDRDRMVRFKLKYRFWGSAPDGTRQVFTYCLDSASEALTRQGWKSLDDISTEDEVLAVDPDTGVQRWERVESVNVFDWDGPLHRWTSSRMDALTTPNHRWMVQDWRSRDPRYADDAKYGRWDVTENLSTLAGSGSTRLRVTGEGTEAFAEYPTFADEFVELIGWAVTEGHYQQSKTKSPTSVIVAQSETANPDYCERIRALAKYFRAQGATVSEYDHAGNCLKWYFGKGIGHLIRAVAPDKRLTPEFLSALTETQAHLLYKTLVDADGYRKAGSEFYTQKRSDMVGDFQMLCFMLGLQTRSREREERFGGGYEVSVYKQSTHGMANVEATEEHYIGKVWCPSVKSKSFVARRNGVTFLTGNTEIMTDDMIEEYINDEMIDQRPNPLGTIPIVHIANIPVEGSPWGLSDIQDITGLNREYNEKATEISDIINYHASPVTVITGAKASNLEKGPRQIWGNLPKDANVFNLDMTTNLSGPLAFMESLKRAMHEMTGVPETALGQRQPISNTSGVALAIEFQPMMNRYSIKEMQYGDGLRRINELIMLTLAAKEPQALQFDPTRESELKPGQYPYLDPQDPLTYESTIDFPPPLPTDVLIKLNELQAKMGMGLESKRGALRELGEEFPDEKLSEIFGELREDMLEQGSLDLLQAEVMAMIQAATGFIVSGGAATPSPTGGEGEEGGETGGEGSSGGVVSAGAGAPDEGVMPGIAVPLDPAQLMNQIVTKAHGTKLAQRRSTPPDDDS